jgi:hypothetical protein
MSHFNMLVFPAVVLPLTARMNLTMAEVLGVSFWMYLLTGFVNWLWGSPAAYLFLGWGPWLLKWQHL